MPAIDPYSAGAPGAAGPADKIFVIAPSDSADLPYVTTAIYVGGGGDIAVKDRATGAVVIHRAAIAGTFIPVRVARVMATGTTATNLVGWA